MKILFLLLIGLNAHAANFATLDELKSEVKTVYTSQEFCPSTCIAIDGHDLEVSELKEIMRPITQCETNEAGEELCQVVGEEPTGQFELKESSLKKLAKEAKQKADEDASKKAKEAQATRQATFKEMAQKNGNFTTAEVQRLLKSLAQERSDEAEQSNLSETQLKLKAQQ